MYIFLSRHKNKEQVCIKKYKKWHEGGDLLLLREQYYKVGAFLRSTQVLAVRRSFFSNFFLVFFAPSPGFPSFFLKCSNFFYSSNFVTNIETLQISEHRKFCREYKTSRILPQFVFNLLNDNEQADHHKEAIFYYCMTSTTFHRIKMYIFLDTK